MRKDLKELWDTARQYGRVNLSTMDDGTYYCCINFNTIEHTEMKARSDFKQPTPEAAIEEAIKMAETIMDSLTKMTAANPLRRLLSWGK